MEMKIENNIENNNEENKTGTATLPPVAGVLIAEAIAAPVGALVYGVTGILGKSCLSFFNSSAASAVGGFSTFAAVGAIAAPLAILPHKISDHLITNSSFLKKHPFLQKFLSDTVYLLLNLASVTAATAMLSLPLVPTVMCAMIIPAAFYLLNQLINVIQACIAPKSSLAEQQQIEGAPKELLIA